MNLSSILISGFKSFKQRDPKKDKMPFLVDEKITVLIGANDHGKTNVLEAIRRLNDDALITEDDRNWDLPEDAQPRLEWHFTLSHEELSQLKEATPATQKPEIPVATEPISAGDFPPSTTVDANILVPAECLPVSGKANTITYFREGIGTSVGVLSTPFEIERKYEAQLLAMRPRVELFSIPPGNNVVDEIKKEHIEDVNYKDHEFIKGLFVTADIWDMRMELFGNTDKSGKKIEVASEKLTTAMQEKWAQNDGSNWKLTQSGDGIDILKLRIQDKAVDAIDVPPSRKSSGFRTFFLLSMMITARIHDSIEKPHIFLFDEPGTYLHPRAQIDLQRSFEKRADDAQIVYTTHSLFLVSKNYPKRNRVISKSKEGTRVDQKPFMSNWKSVRDSLGIIMSNNFLIADKSILFEGPSDQFYLYNAIRKLKSDEVDIDLNDFSTVDGGDSENYLAMAKVLMEEGRSMLCITDGDKAGERILESVAKVQKDEIEKRKARIKKYPEEASGSNPSVFPMQLAQGKSVEDIFADKTLLLKAIKNVADNLLHLEIRELDEGVQIEQRIEAIRSASGKTLGAIIDEETAKWFKPDSGKAKESLSKLSIALEYDHLAHEEDYAVTANAKRVVLEIKRILDLKGEKSEETGALKELD